MSFYVTNILCIAVLIAVHEYGHFYFARRYGIRPPEFSVGFGPKLVSFHYDGTRFSLGVIPFGGFVKIPKEEMGALTRWERIKIFFGGPLANMLLCVTIGIVYALFGTFPENTILHELTGIPKLYQVLILGFGSIVLFILAVPFSIYVLFNIFTSPIESLEKVDGPIGIVSGKWIPTDLMSGLSLLEQVMIMTWVLSLSLGTFNLVPISILDGGQIFRELFIKFPKFVRSWEVVTTGLFMVLVIYMIGGDIYKIF